MAMQAQHEASAEEESFGPQPISRLEVKYAQRQRFLQSSLVHGVWQATLRLSKMMLTVLQRELECCPCAQYTTSVCSVYHIITFLLWHWKYFVSSSTLREGLLHSLCLHIHVCVWRVVCFFFIRMGFQACYSQTITLSVLKVIQNKQNEC